MILASRFSFESHGWGVINGGLPRLDGNPIVHIDGAVSGEGIDGSDDGGAGVLVCVSQPSVIRDTHPR